MKHLLSVWHEVEPLLKERTLMLFLDYDGTLTPIVNHPKEAKLSEGGKKVLRGMTLTPGIKTVIVSGRSLADVKKLVRIAGLLYVGNHGLELEGPAINFVHPQAVEAKKLIEKIRIRLRPALRSFTGVVIEDKTFTLSVHYRRLAQSKVEPARLVFLRILRPYARAAKVILTEGKKVWEVRPAIRWNKGTTVLWLYGRVLAQSSEERILPLYVGDDRTDEDAFRALKPVGLSVKVVDSEADDTDADYFLRSPKEVFDFLNRVQNLKAEPPLRKREKIFTAG